MPNHIKFDLEDYVTNGLSITQLSPIDAGPIVDLGPIELNAPVINYDFEDKKCQNKDSTYPASAVNCTYRNDVLKDETVIELNPGGSFIKIPVSERLTAANAFGIEMEICPTELKGNTINLMEGQAIPFSFSLKKEKTGYYLHASVNLNSHWQGVTAKKRVVSIQASQPIKLNNWLKVAMVFTGDDIFLFIDDQCVARRVFKNASVTPVGKKDYYIGTCGDGKKNQFVGYINNVNFWDMLPFKFKKEIEEAEKTGLGEIECKHLSCGGNSGFLGKQDYADTLIMQGTGDNRYFVGRRGNFKHGKIYWSEKTGAHEVHGNINNTYNQMGGPTQTLGFPISDEQAGKVRGVRFNRFENGAIYWSSETGAHAIWGHIYVHYIELNAEKSFLGLPITEAIHIPSEQNIHWAEKTIFQHGTIYWSPRTGAFEVHGSIRNKFESLIAEGTKIGYPISDELDVLNSHGKPTGGKMSNFEYATIYWHRSTGAFEVQGAIRKCYLENGGPLGKFGYPTSDEMSVPNTNIKYSEFQNGIIVWKPGIGAIGLTELDLYIGMAVSGNIDDGFGRGIFDRSAELITYTYVDANNQTLDNGTMRPSDHAGTSYNIDKKYHITPINHNTKINMKVKFKDWDAASGEDYLGTIDKTFDITTLWGLANGADGVFNQHPLTHKGSHSSSHNSVRLTFVIQIPSHFNPNKSFREQCWWDFDNFTTKTLSRDFYANTFKDVDIINNNFYEQAINPIDSLFYESVYKSIAAGGNCFGMSTEALCALQGSSCFTIPLDKYKAKGNKKSISTENDLAPHIYMPINRKHGYQVGTSSVNWTLKKLLNLDAIRPLNVFSSVKTRLNNFQKVLVSMFDIKTGVGHTVLAYKYEDNGNRKRIYVADPNLPNSLKADPKHPTYIEVYDNNTFEFYDGSVVTFKSRTMLKDLLPRVFMFETPYHVVSTMPTTPYIHILIGLAILLKGLIILAGDAEISQISAGGNHKFYQQSGNQKNIVVNGIRGMAKIMPTDSTGIQMYAQKGTISKKLNFEVKGKKTGNYTLQMRTKDNVILVESPIKARQNDKIQLRKLDSSRPVLSFETTSPLKMVKFTYGIINDVKGRGSRLYNVSIPTAKTGKTLITFEDRGDSFIIAPAGNPKSITTIISLLKNNQLKNYQITLKPNTPKGLYKIKLGDIEKTKNVILIEELSGVNGKLLQKKIKPLKTKSIISL